MCGRLASDLGLGSPSWLLRLETSRAPKNPCGTRRSCKIALRRSSPVFTASWPLGVRKFPKCCVQPGMGSHAGAMTPGGFAFAPRCPGNFAGGRRRVPRGIKADAEVFRIRRASQSKTRDSRLARSRPARGVHCRNTRANSVRVSGNGARGVVDFVSRADRLCARLRDRQAKARRRPARNHGWSMISSSGFTRPAR